MKRFLALSGIALLIASCQISIGTPETTDNISGYYSLTSALWSSPVDISGHGDASEDLRHQLLMYGWWGTMTQTGLSEEKSALDASVLLPLPSDGLGQINLFIPFFYYDGDGATELPQPPTPHEGRCCVVMTRTTFNYEYDENNNINVILSGVPSEGGNFSDEIPHA